MTRVNLIKPEHLADQHLFAEWRELKMIPVRVRKNLATNKVMEDLPKKYTMSTGHVRFFYDKMGWLCQRHEMLREELRERNFNVSDFDSQDAFLGGMPKKYAKDWVPSTEEVLINTERIGTRLQEKPRWYRFYGEVMPTEFFERLYV